MNRHIAALSHVGIYTSDLDRSLEWYTQVLGLEEAFRLERDGRVTIIYLHMTPGTFLELFAPRPDQPKPPHAHFSIEIEDVEAATADLLTRLPEESIRSREIVTGIDGSRIFNFFDPDGHRIEFQQFPADSNQAQARERMEARG